MLPPTPSTESDDCTIREPLEPDEDCPDDINIPPLVPPAPPIVLIENDPDEELDELPLDKDTDPPWIDEPAVTAILPFAFGALVTSIITLMLPPTPDKVLPEVIAIDPLLPTLLDPVFIDKLPEVSASWLAELIAVRNVNAPLERFSPELD